MKRRDLEWRRRVVWRGSPPHYRPLPLEIESVYLAAPLRHRAGQATAANVLAKRRRCDYYISDCSSSRERLTPGKGGSSFALTAAGKGCGKTLILRGGRPLALFG